MWNDTTDCINYWPNILQPQNYAYKINKMPEMYVKFALKLNKFPKFYIYPQNAQMLHGNFPKIFFPNFFLWGRGHVPSSLLPISCAYVQDIWQFKAVILKSF